MMVGNDVRHDTRVLKSALALADAGLDVTVLGLSTTGRREESDLGPVRIIRVPAGRVVRDAAALQRSRRRSRLALAVPEQERQAREQRLTLRQRDRELQDDLGARVRAAQVDLAHRSVRARAEADRRLRRVERLGWRLVDAAVSRTPVAASWRRVLPEIDDYALALGPVVDSLEWDVIHAHDVHLVGIASHAVARRRRSGRRADWVYDAHEYVAGISLYGSRTRRKRAAYLDLEREYIRDAAAVVTVTDPLADRLRRDHHLRARPTVVMNSPVLGPLAPDAPSLRRTVGLADDVPLLVYAGGVSAARGIGTAVEALVRLPAVHLAVVAVPSVGVQAAQRLAEHAERLGVVDRFHLVDPVAPEQVSAFVSSADVGLLPLLHFGSHEVALANKLFEYLQGGLPVLVSDCRAQADFVSTHGVGRVHVAGDVDSFVREVEPLLRGESVPAPGLVAELLAPLAWEHQAERLRGVYARLLDQGPASGPGASQRHRFEVERPDRATQGTVGLTELADVVEVPVPTATRPSVLAIGPANMAGQAWEWARAAERVVPGMRAEVLSVDRGSAVAFEADVVVPASTFARDREWAERRQTEALATWTHALLEAGRPVFGTMNGRDFTGDANVLRAGGVEVGLVMHGSEIRSPAGNAARSPWSPFRDPGESLTRRLQEQWETLHPRVRAFDGPVFVSTPDLLVDLPEAHLLPVVVDVDGWASTAPVLERDVPRVVHAPSRAALKGSHHVERTMARLVAEGLVDYVRLEGVPPEEVRAEVRTCDVVLDQFSIGTYGVLAAEAMAAGRLVVSYVSPLVRRAVEDELPIVEATPDDLDDVLRSLLKDRDTARTTAAAGVPFVRARHDGRRSGEVLRDVLGLRGPV